MPIFETIPTQGIPIKVFADQLEEKARRQLIDLAESGIAEHFVAAMPDVHYGLGATIGSVFASSWAVCPNAVGVDIGCGMAAIPFPGLTRDILTVEARWALHRRIKVEVPTGMLVHQQEKWAPVLDDLARTPWLSTQLQGRALRSLGTLGGGNHFIEVVCDPAGQVWVMLHSGSRNLGKITADRYNDLAKSFMAGRDEAPRNRDLNFLLVDSQEGQDYLLDMVWCQKFAQANRQAMLEILARVVFDQTGFGSDWGQMVNIHHNFCALETCRLPDGQGGWIERDLWITRKGATSARAGERGLIPGSMAVGSFLVEGLGNWESWSSCSHGAGRTKSRTASFAQISQQSFVEAMAGIVAETVPELRDEAPQAYKDLEGVMACQSDLVRPLLKLSPLVNVKGWDPAGGRPKQPWNPVKLPVRFTGGLDLRVLEVEVHVSAAGKKPGAQWVRAEDFVLRSSGEVLNTTRELWVRTAQDPGKRALIVTRVSAVGEAELVLEILSVKKKEAEEAEGPP